MTLVRLSPEVEAGLAGGGPVVALETTLVSHGFPGEEGLRVGLECEERVREAGAIPATVGVLDGAVRVGLAREELERFAGDDTIRKAGPRDLAACAASGEPGATTVGGTLAACRAAGVRFMGTGGLGGVHRGWTEHLDVSADLGALASTQALVVASGAKSILDVPATSELLESLGVPVLGFRTDTLPLFYAAEGGPPVSSRVESAAEAARVAALHWELGGGGVLVGRPPDGSLDVDGLIARGVAEAERLGIRGQKATPFLLAYLHRESGGRTVEANKRLIVANAGLAAEIAVAHAGG